MVIAIIIQSLVIALMTFVCFGVAGVYKDKGKQAIENKFLTVLKDKAGTADYNKTTMYLLYDELFKDENK